MTSSFSQNAIVATDKKSDVEDSTNFRDTSVLHTVQELMVSGSPAVTKSSAVDPAVAEFKIKPEFESGTKVNSIKRNTSVLKEDENNLVNDDEPIAFTEESLKVFDNSDLTKEENKIIEALDDTISGYINAAFDESNDPLDGEANVDEEVFEEQRPDSRSSVTSNQSESDKPGIIMRRDSDARRLKRPNSVSFQLPENHVDKQTNGQYVTRTLPVSGGARGYKRVLSSQFYSYRPNSVWSSQNFMRHHSDEEERPVVPKRTESLSKKTIGPFNASFSGWLRKKPKGSEKLKPLQNGMVNTESNVKLNLPTHTKKRATILDADTTKLIPRLETNVAQHNGPDYTMSNKPYVVQEFDNISPRGETAKGDKFLY